MKILVVSGFLGAGKTTFIREMARRTGGPVVILENEFGEVGVDGDFLSDLPLEVVELAQGCICCSMRTDFLRAVTEIRERFCPDVLIIEPTGVASLSLILASLPRGLEAGDSLAPAVTVVDAEAFSDYIEVFGEFYRDQIAGASTLIVTKSEALSAGEREAVLQGLAGLNPGAEVVLPPYEALPREWWARLLEAEGTAVVPSGGAETLSLESLGLTGLAFPSREPLERLLERLLSGEFGRVYRVKGLAPVGDGWLRFDAAHRRVAVEPREPAAASKLALVGEALDAVAVRMALSEFRTEPE